MILLKFALVFLIVAMVAALFGFTSIVAAAVGIAKTLFFIFLALFILALLGAVILRV